MENSKNQGKYDDILHLPHPTSSKRPRMPAASRAAQFSPFAALTGYGEAVEETTRLTEQRIELGEEEKAILDERLQTIQRHWKESPEVTITYFRPDEKKEGGVYESVVGRIRKIDLYERRMIMQDDLKIPLDEIVEIESKLFSSCFT